MPANWIVHVLWQPTSAKPEMITVAALCARSPSGKEPVFAVLMNESIRLLLAKSPGGWAGTMTVEHQPTKNDPPPGPPDWRDAELELWYLGRTDKPDF
jgi:hypothetical protein